MRSRAVRFSPEARADLLRLYHNIADAAGPRVAAGYVRRLRTYCEGFSIASERGRRRDDIAQDLWVVGFERRITIAFTLDSTTVTILRFFYGGRDWETILHDTGGA